MKVRFPLSMKSSRVVVDVTKTKKHVYQGGSASSKTTITVMLATSAAGHYIRPMVVYAGVQPRTELREHFHEVMPDAIFANTEEWWMNQQLFVDWLQKFNEDLITRRVLKPRSSSSWRSFGTHLDSSGRVLFDERNIPVYAVPTFDSCDAATRSGVNGKY